jgi:hypothetical protein
LTHGRCNQSINQSIKQSINQRLTEQLRRFLLLILQLPQVRRNALLLLRVQLLQVLQLVKKNFVACFQIAAANGGLLELIMSRIIIFFLSSRMHAFHAPESRVL